MCSLAQLGIGVPVRRVNDEHVIDANSNDEERRHEREITRLVADVG